MPDIASNSDAALVASGVSVGYRSRDGVRRVVGDVTLELSRRRILGLAGESGCGKSTLALTLMGYRAPNGVVLGGSVVVGGVDLLAASARELQRLWGAEVAYLPQDTSTALNPALRIGSQLAEPLRLHGRASRDAALPRVLEVLRQVGIPEPERALDRYPHQFSGGQQQRIALALGLACTPQVLILDEPTTGLDVTTQARINELIADLTREVGTATIYVSHNLALLATICDDLAIMYGGQIVEHGPAHEVFAAPRHPYTAALIEAVPTVRRRHRPTGIPGVPPPVVVDDRCAFSARCSYARDECLVPVELRQIEPARVGRCVRMEELGPRPVPPAAATADRVEPAPVAAAGPVLATRELRCEFRHRSHVVVAVDGVSVGVASGRVLGIAGESGSGKSTLLRALVGLLRPAGGEMEFRGAPLSPSVARRPPEVRRAIQIVFQNPDATLNPRHTVFQALERPLRLFRHDVGARDRRAFAAEVLGQMRLGPQLLDRYPRHLSGGQRQRVALARALVVEPDVILCDEVTSALDVSVQATILDLLMALREKRRTALVFVTHDLGVLRAIADDAVVMEHGVVCEAGRADDVLARPRHPYTRNLLDSVPDPDRRQLVAG